MKNLGQKLYKLHSLLKNLFAFVLFFGLGAISTLLITYTFAHGGDTSKIHACVRNNALFNGAPNIRIVGANTNCNNKETALDWNIQGIQGPPGSGGSSAFVCPNCTKKDILARTHGSDLSRENFDLSILNYSKLTGEDLSESSFVNGLFYQTMFNNTDLTGADFSDANLDSATFENANLTESNFTNANLTNASLTGAITTDSIFTGVTWSYTWCPDGTNSDDNGNTCVSHLTP